jgi:hypothetical protein
MIKLRETDLPLSLLFFQASMMCTWLCMYACPRYKGIRVGGGRPGGQPNGRQAGMRLVVGRQAFGWYAGRQRHAGLVRR